MFYRNGQSSRLFGVLILKNSDQNDPESKFRTALLISFSGQVFFSFLSIQYAAFFNFVINRKSFIILFQFLEFIILWSFPFSVIIYVFLLPIDFMCTFKLIEITVNNRELMVPLFENTITIGQILINGISLKFVQFWIFHAWTEMQVFLMTSYSRWRSLKFGEKHSVQN